MPINLGFGLPSKLTPDGLRVYEIEPDRWVSRQRVWQLRQVKARCCIVCGQPARSTNVRLCVAHKTHKARVESIAKKRRKLTKRTTHAMVTTPC